MSFVSKGEKKMHNMVKPGGKGGNVSRVGDSFGQKGDGRRPGAPHNKAPGSKDKANESVSVDVSTDKPQGFSDEGVGKSTYDPASGKRAGSIADLRSAQKKLNERSLAGSASPTGSEGGQDAKHLKSSKNNSGYMKNSGMGKLDKLSKKPPRSMASQTADEMTDPMDEDEEDSGQTKIGMTAKGKSRSKMKKPM